MAIITKPFPTTNGTVAQGSDVASNFDTIYNDYNGNITNANISASAGITDDRLAAVSTFGKVLGSSLSTLAGISASAGLIPTKNGGLNNDLSGAITGSIAYFSSAGTGNFLASGASNTVLMSTGTSANPTYTAILPSIKDFGTDNTNFTVINLVNLKICYGSTGSLTNGSTFTLGSLPFASSSSYRLVNSRIFTDTGHQSPAEVTQTSGTTATLTNNGGDTTSFNWIAIGT